MQTLIQAPDKHLPSISYVLGNVFKEEMKEMWYRLSGAGHLEKVAIMEKQSELGAT